MDFCKICVGSLLIVILSVGSAEEHASNFNGDAFLEELKILANDLLGVERFQRYVDQQEYGVSKIDGHGLINNLANALQVKFQRRINAVTDLSKAIKEVYKRDDSSSAIRFPSCCSKLQGDAIDRRFKVKVDMDTPCVIRPNQQDQADVLDDETIAEVMKNNMQNIVGMKWQYYGSYDGQHTTYPRKQICDKNYDPRYRPWYVVAATPEPKDVVLVIDTSGSMKIFGKIRLLDIASKAADTVISFLNPNDRVAVVSFSDTVKTVSTCYKDELAFATHNNKETLKNYLDTLEAEGETEYGLALKKAFQYFKNSIKLTADDSRRDKVILFFTDGDPTDAGGSDSIMQIIREENANLSNTVVISTYGFGDILPDTAELLKNMSRQVTYDKSSGEVTTGESHLLAEPDELISKMGSFYTFFSKEPEKQTVVFTIPYNDAFGIGLVMSACLPVHHQRELKGVTCVDISVSELLSDVTYFRHGELSYAFLIDDKGRVIIHPLMPNPYYVSNDPVYLKATTIETARGFDEIMKSMMSGLKGNKTMKSTRVYPRGDVDKEGVKQQSVTSNYIWQKIENTHFSVCVVIDVEDTDVTLTWNKAYPVDFVYHHDFRNKTTCNHFGRTVNPGISSVKFTPEAFQRPWEYMEGVDNNRIVDHYYDIMTGKIKDSESLFKETVKNTVALSAKLNDLWKESGHSAIWLYFGTVDGIFRKLPSAVQPYGYDHKLRPWYQRTLGQKGLYTLSVPYVDASGTGIVLTLGHVIYEGKSGGNHEESDPVIGVLAMDFPVKHIYHILLTQFPDCEHENECFILDNTGFIIVHPSFFKPHTDARNTQSVHITMKEPEIAYDLLEKKRMVKETCTDFGDFQNQLTYLITLKYDKALITDEYEIHEVRGSNIFLVKKKDAFKTRNVCHCHYDKNRGMQETRECNKVKCECPCHTPMIYNQCRENITRTLDDPVACTPALPPGDSFGPTEKAHPSLPLCESRRCSDIISKGRCTKKLGCNWCSTDTFGKDLDLEYCTDTVVCNPITRIPEDTTMSVEENKPAYTTMSVEEENEPALANGDIAGICIAVVFVILIVLAIVFILLRRCAKLKSADHSQLEIEDQTTYTLDAGCVDNEAMERPTAEPDEGESPTDSIDSGGIYSSPDSLPVVPPEYSNPHPLPEVPPPPYTFKPESRPAAEPTVEYIAVGSPQQRSPHEPMPHTNLIPVSVSSNEPEAKPVVFSDEPETILKRPFNA